MFINSEELKRRVTRLKVSQGDLRDALIRRIFDPVVMRSGRQRQFSMDDRQITSKPSRMEKRWVMPKISKMEAHLDVVTEKLRVSEAMVNRGVA